MNFGWTQSFGGLGSGGGVKKPADPNDILQWMTAYDGATPFVDRKDVVASPDAVGANYLTTNGTGFASIPCTRNLTDDFNLSFWITAPSAVANKFAILRYNSTGDQRSFYVQLASSGKLNVTISTDGTTLTTFTTTASIDDGNFHHIYITAEAGGFWIYIDGVIDTVSTASGKIPFSVSEPVQLGGFSGNTFTGGLSNVEMYSGDTAYDVYIMVGQSNMEGVNASYGTLPTTLQGKQHHRFQLNINGGAQTLDNANLQPFNGSNWGPELTFGEKLTSRTGRRSLIIKVAEGGTNMHTDWQKGGTMYNLLIPTYNAAITHLTNAGYTVNSINSIIMQGESDSTAEATANAWEANYKQFISDMQSDLGITLNHQIICRIHNNLPGGYAYASTVRVAQDSLGARSNSTLVDTDSLPLQGDSIHFTDTGYQMLGQAMADASPLYSHSDSYVFHAPLAEGATTRYDIIGTGSESTSDTTGSGFSVDIPNINILNGFCGYSIFNGVDDALLVTPLLAETRNNVTFEFDIEYNVADQGVFVAGSAGSKYIVAASDGDPSTTIYSGAGTPTIKVDGVTKTTRDELYDAMFGSRTTLRIEGADLSTWTELQLFELSTSTQWNVGANVYNVKIDWDSSGSWDDIITPDFGGKNGMFASGTLFTNVGTGGGAGIIPALADGSSAADGNPITNKGGYVHNGAECSIIQTDADTNAFGGASFWGDGASWTAKSYADMRAHYNGDTNTFFKCVCIDGVPHYREATQYDVTKVFDNE